MLATSTVDFAPSQPAGVPSQRPGSARRGSQRSQVPQVWTSAHSRATPGTATCVSTVPGMAAARRRICVVLDEARARRRSRPPGLRRDQAMPGLVVAMAGKPTCSRDAGGSRRPRRWAVVEALRVHRDPRQAVGREPRAACGSGLQRGQALRTARTTGTFVKVAEGHRSRRLALNPLAEEARASGSSDPRDGGIRAAGDGAAQWPTRWRRDPPSGRPVPRWRSSCSPRPVSGPWRCCTSSGPISIRCVRS